MKCHTLIVGGLLVMSAGCAGLPGLPSQLQPPSAAIQAQDKADPAVMDLTIKLAVGGGDRAVQFNGGSGALQQDIDNLIIGLFDNGSGTSFVSSLGYLYTGTVGGATTAATITTTSTPMSPGYMSDLINNRLGTAGTGVAGSGLSISSDASNARRFLIRDYGTATGFTGTTTVNFSNIPAAGTNGHAYIIFAAAYDSADNNLGYTEASLPDTKASGTSNQTAAQLTLNLKQNVFTNTLAETPILTTFVPSATLRGLLP